MRATFALAYATALVACAHSRPTSARYDRASAALDDMERRLEEWGTASVSNPLLAKPNDNFKFAPAKITADTLFEQARGDTQGRSGVLDEWSLVAGFGATASADPTQAAAYAAQLEAYRADAAAVARKRELLDRAAYAEYQAALDAAKEKATPSERAAAEAEAYRTLAARLSGPAADAASSYPSSSVTPPDAKTELVGAPKDALARLAGDRFLGSQGLFPNAGPLALSNRAALLTAASDNITKSILSLFGDPQQLAQFEDKTVLYGVATVSVEPGWRTREKHAAVISVRARYRYAEPRFEYLSKLLADETVPCSIRAAVARNYQELFPGRSVLSPKHDRVEECTIHHADPGPTALCRYGGVDTQRVFPFGTAISPLVESQTLDLQSSQRHSIALSAMLAAQLQRAGLKTQAQAMAEFARSLQRDTATRTANVAVSTFNHSGNMFGFEVGPLLVGADVAKQSGATEKLGRQSFPALFILGFDTRDLRPGIVGCSLDGKDVKIPDEPCAGGNGQGGGGVGIAATPGKMSCTIQEPLLVLTTTTRWKPLDGGFWWWQPTRLTEAQRMETAYAVRKTLNDLDSSTSADKTEKVIDYLLKARADSLRTEVNGSDAVIPLPTELLFPPEKKPSPQVAAIFPPTVVLSRDGKGGFKPKAVDVIVSGDHLESVKPLEKVSIATGAATFADPAHPARTLGKSLAVKLTVTSPDSPIVLALPREEGGPLYAPPVVVRGDDEPKLLFIRRTSGHAGDKAKQQVETLEFPAEMPGDIVKAAIESRKGKESSPPKKQ